MGIIENKIEFLEKLLEGTNTKQESLVNELTKTCEELSAECEMIGEEKAKVFDEIFEIFVRYPMGQPLTKLVSEETTLRIAVFNNGIFQLSGGEFNNRQLSHSAVQFEYDIFEKDAAYMSIEDIHKEISGLENVNIDMERILQEVVVVCGTVTACIEAEYKERVNENNTIEDYKNEMSIEKMRLEKELLKKNKEKGTTENGNGPRSESNTLFDLEAQIKELYKRFQQTYVS